MLLTMILRIDSSHFSKEESLAMKFAERPWVEVGKPTNRRRLAGLLCSAVHEIEEWIAAGKSLQVHQECKTTPLQTAMERGFHSLVVLLTRRIIGQHPKKDALFNTGSKRNLELTEFLLKHGAHFSSLPFRIFCLRGTPSLIGFFLKCGADFINGTPLAKAFVVKVRTWVRFPFARSINLLMQLALLASQRDNGKRQR